MSDVIRDAPQQAFRNYRELKDKLDGAVWGRSHSLVFITLSASLFVWGVVLAVGPLVISWPMVTPSSVLYILVAAPSGLLTGNLVMGILADRLGRKKSFMLTLIISIAGLAGILLSETIWLLIASLFLTEFGFGGEETVSLALMSELFPIRYRGKALVGSTNFANAGAMLVALAFIASPFSIIDEKIMIAILAAGGLGIALVSRLLIPESLRWAFVKEKGPKTAAPLKVREGAFSFAVLATVASTIILTYALLALVLGPFEFPHLVGAIVFTYNLGETAAGFAAIFIVSMLSRKGFTLFAFAGGFITMLPFIAYYYIAPASLLFFLSLLFINGAFGEFGWAARNMMQPELFTTRFRGTGIGSVRGIGYVLYIASLFLVYGYTPAEYIYYASFIWLAGLIAAAAWYVKGRETSGESLD